MSGPINNRLAAFTVAIVAVASMIGWAAGKTWSEARQLAKKVEEAQVASFEIADHFQAVVLDLNDRWLRFDRGHQPEDKDRFVQESRALQLWIEAEADKLNNPHERQILKIAAQAFDQFCGQAMKLFELEKGMPAPTASLLDQTKLLLSLGNRLSDAHREVVGQLITSTQVSLRILQQLIFGLLCFLLALGAGLAVLVYRDLIRPLRLKLVESRAIIERQEKLSSLGVLAAGVAHEIRNPLTAIKARLFIQMKSLKPGSGEMADAGIIGQEINRLERIVKDFLIFARPSEPQLSLVPAASPLREARKLIAPPLSQKQIALQIEEGPPATIEVDPEQIKQVLINLIQNAADSIERNGTITLRVRLDSLRRENNPISTVILEVQDTGKGIPVEVQKRLFDPFFSTKEGGTGLGLSIASRIVEKQGGFLIYHTSPDHGTTFGIVLPRKR